MDKFMKETVKPPKLTEIKIPIEVPEPKVKGVIKLSKWNLNIILIVLFIVFSIFFLYNCKYGIFKTVDTEFLLYPYLNS